MIYKSKGYDSEQWHVVATPKVILWNYKDSNDGFIQAELIFRRELEPENITVESYLFETLLVQLRIHL